MRDNGIRRLAIAAVGIAALSGCGHFENPLPWSESPSADRLVGSWEAVEGRETGAVVYVTRAGDRGLRFDMTYPEGTPATTKEGKYKRHAEFRADFLGSNSVDVLQIDASSYEEFDDTGDSVGSAGDGYLFLRIKFGPDGDVRVHRLDRTLLGQVAEAELAGTGVRLDIDKVFGCLGEDLRSYAWLEFLKAVAEEVGELLAEILKAAFGTNGDPVGELDRDIDRLDELEVDPYQELARLRTCVARHLPGEWLGDLFSHHAETLFLASVDRYAPRP